MHGMFVEFGRWSGGGRALMEGSPRGVPRPGGGRALMEGALGAPQGPGRQGPGSET